MHRAQLFEQPVGVAGVPGADGWPAVSDQFPGRQIVIGRKLAVCWPRADPHEVGRTENVSDMLEKWPPRGRMAREQPCTLGPSGQCRALLATADVPAAGGNPTRPLDVLPERSASPLCAKAGKDVSPRRVGWLLLKWSEGDWRVPLWCAISATRLLLTQNWQR